MNTEKMGNKPIIPTDKSGVPKPGEVVTGTLAEIFGFTITDEARKTYANNMLAIQDNERKADEIARTIFL